MDGVEISYPLLARWLLVLLCVVSLLYGGCVLSLLGSCRSLQPTSGRTVELLRAAQLCGYSELRVTPIGCQHNKDPTQFCTTKQTSVRGDFAREGA